MNANYSSHTQAELSVCNIDATEPICVSTFSIMRYVFKLGFYTLREKQDEISRRMEKDVESLASSGENTQFVIIGTCVGLIILSAVVVMPIFVWVLKDKSSVLAIFSDIQPEEAAKIIDDSRQLDIKNLRFKRKWMTTTGENSEAFWKKLVREHRRGFGRDADAPRKLRKDQDKSAKEADPGLSLIEKLGVPPEAKDPGKTPGSDADASKDPEQEDESEIAQEEGTMRKSKEEKEKQEKKRRRRERLSEIDYPLRRRFLVRIVLVFLMFFCYAGFASYFNWYVHVKNAEASNMLFSLCKRNIYIHTMDYVLSEAITTNNSVLAGNNPTGDGVQYMMDIADELLQIEQEAKDFEKTGSRSIYQDYFNYVNWAESSDFCNASDAYSDIPVVTGLTNCAALYRGPMNGLSAGISYLLKMHIGLANQFISMNYSDPAAAAASVAAMFFSVSISGPFYTFELSFVLGEMLALFCDCALRFFDLVRKIVYAASICFLSVFVAVYVIVFFRFIITLNNEIWQTREMVNVIPAEILNSNRAVREQVWKRRS